MGGLIGAGTTVAIDKANDKDTVELVEAIGQLKDTLGEGQKQVQINLTDQDLLKVACSSEWMEKNTDALCREMFCRMQQRGIDAQTSQGDCSEIANIANTKSIQNACKDSKGDDFDSCVDLFFKRK